MYIFVLSALSRYLNDNPSRLSTPLTATYYYGQASRRYSWGWPTRPVCVLLMSCILATSSLSQPCHVMTVPINSMLAEYANRIGITIAILDLLNNPAAEVTTGPHVEGNFKDSNAILQLGKVADVLTVEIEHVDTDALERAEKELGIPCHPSPQTIRNIQDKYLQKEVLQKAGLPVSTFDQLPRGEEVVTIEKLVASGNYGYPLMLKSRTLAYDGRGNRVIRSASEISAAVEELGGGPNKNGPALYVEKWVPFVKELAVMVAKSVNGEVASYPTVETVQKDNICHIVIAPAQVDGAVAARARQIAEASVQALHGAGIFGVEMFLLENGMSLAINSSWFQRKQYQDC